MSWRRVGVGFFGISREYVRFFDVEIIEVRFVRGWEERRSDW